MVYKEIIAFKNEFLQRLEIKLNMILKKNLDLSCNWIEGLLAKQKMQDFKPKEEILSNPEPTAVTLLI
jgi:hypothetical protein